MPLHDWQFWLVSFLALIGLWLVLKPLLAARGSSKSTTSCANCSAGNATSSASLRPRRVTLTIERRRA